MPFMLAANFWMGACKQDDVVVVIKMGALFVDAYSETYHMLLSLFAPHQTLSPRVVGDYCTSCVPWQGHTVEFSFKIKLSEEDGHG